MPGDAGTTHTINLHTIISLAGRLTRGFLEANHFVAAAPFAWAARSELPSAFASEPRPALRTAASLPGHFCDEGGDNAARNKTLRENAEFIYKTGNHESAAVRQ